MSGWKPGDVVFREGTIGAKSEKIKMPVLIVAVNETEKTGGSPVYTCLPVTSRPMDRAGSVPFVASGKETKYANVGRMLIAGESSFIASPVTGTPLLDRVTPEELAKTRAVMDALLTTSAAHTGKIVYTATPSHDGDRGKTHRPYVLLGEIGRGTGNYWAVPVSSHASPVGNGAEITDLESAGLVRAPGEKSHTRFAWSAAVSTRTSSKVAGALSDGDKKILADQTRALKKTLLTGGYVSPLSERLQALRCSPPAQNPTSPLKTPAPAPEKPHPAISAAITA